MMSGHFLKALRKNSTPNQIWVSDVTFFKLNKNAFYICVIIDLFSRKVVAHKISTKNSTQLVKSTFKTAYKECKPNGQLLFHTDRGYNYLSNMFRRYLKELDIEQSFSRVSMPYDKSVCESFFGGMKREELYRTKYRCENELRNGVNSYIIFYNEQRPHSTIRYKTPNHFEAEYACKHNVLEIYDWT